MSILRHAPPSRDGLPPRAGVGLKPAHYATILDGRPDIGFFEIHAENYMGAGGPPHRYLEAIAERYALSLHGVGLSIGGAEPLDTAHLARLCLLNDRYRPLAFSEHLAWSSHGGSFLNDLLPLPYDDETLSAVADHVDAVQQAMGRQLLLENPATYLRFANSTIDEIDFLESVVERTGCGLLLDVNNVMVSAVNHGIDPYTYIDRFPMAAVGEIHLAGYDETVDADGARLLIDAHGSAVRPDVFALYRHTLRRRGPLPTLIEWDNDVPDFATLLAEADRVEAVLGEVRSCGGLVSPSPCPSPSRGEGTLWHHRDMPVISLAGGDRVPSPREGEGQGEGVGREGGIGMTHAATQTAFAAALIDPQQPLPDGIAGAAAASRFAVYRNNVARGLIAALGESFPVTARLVGEDFFNGMARTYAATRQPASPLMFAYGSDFPDFIAGFAPAAALPYLPDVARLEAARTRAYHAADMASLDLAVLAGRSNGALAATRLQLHPAVRLLASAHPVGSIWQAHQQDPVDSGFAWQAETVLTARPDALVMTHILPPDAATFARALFAGDSLGEAAEATMTAHPEFDFGSALAGLAGLGTFAALPLLERS